MQRWRMEKEDDNRHVVRCNSRPPPLPCTGSIIDQMSSWFFSIDGRMYDLYRLLIRHHVPNLIHIDEAFDTTLMHLAEKNKCEEPYPICCKYNKQVLVGYTSLCYIRHRNETKMLNTKISERSRQWQPRRFPIRQPNTVRPGFILQAENPPVALCYPLGLLYA